jgi:hypothetical protein
MLKGDFQTFKPAFLEYALQEAWGHPISSPMYNDPCQTPKGLLFYYLLFEISVFSTEVG